MQVASAYSGDSPLNIVSNITQWVQTTIVNDGLFSVVVVYAFVGVKYTYVIAKISCIKHITLSYHWQNIIVYVYTLCWCKL